jgi:predicted metal-dependent hydrolase
MIHMDLFTAFARRSSGRPAIQTRHLTYGTERIPFQVIRSSKRHRTLSVQVRPDGQVRVAAPVQVSNAEIDAMIVRRAGWIWRQLQRIRVHSRLLQTYSYISGERHPYLGEQYPLKIIEDINIKNSVKLHRGRLEVSTRLPEPELVRAQLRAWYRDQAGPVFKRRLEALLSSLSWQPAATPLLQLRYMKRRWGSCSHQGVITLNPHLVKAPVECVDYVIAHELCHLRELNHSPRFYRLLDQVLPGWPASRTQLDGMAGRLLNGG